MAITADTVMALRQATAAGMMDCKHALEETRGEVEQAADWLRMKGVTTARPKDPRGEARAWRCLRAPQPADWRTG